MSAYKPTIGLEIHAQLKTTTKMFCASPNNPDEQQPNVNICPVCMGHPGTLPVINKKAVEHVLRVGVAAGGELADFTEFDRKNYFYPDIPKGYQISQYKYPLVRGGSISGVELTRIHLEEDTARNVHDKGEGSGVDFNRAGVPLMELVTEPVISSAQEAADFARELQLLLRYLEVSDADMEKGHMRVEANVSVSKTDELGVKTEIKNLNSFKNAQRAIEYEIKRQQEVLESGGEVVQETRGWDESKQKTFSQRTKESSHDYRYFPEPDLPKLKLSEIPEFSEEELRTTLPELPWEKRARYIQEYGIKETDAHTLVGDTVLREFFEAVAETLAGKRSAIQTAANYLTSDVTGLLKKDTSYRLPSAEHFAQLVAMLTTGEISSRGAKDILPILLSTDENPKDIAQKEGLLQQNDAQALTEIVQKIITENELVVAEYKAGKESALQFLIGQGMKHSGGAANPKILQEELKKLLQ